MQSGSNFQGINVRYESGTVLFDSYLETGSGYKGSPNVVKFSSDGQRIIFGYYPIPNRIVDIFDPQTGNKLARYTGNTNDTAAIALVFNSRSVICSRSNKLQLIDISSSNVLRTFEDADALLVTPDGRNMISKSSDTLKMWDIQTGKELRT